MKHIILAAATAAILGFAPPLRAAPFDADTGTLEDLVAFEYAFRDEVIAAGAAKNQLVTDALCAKFNDTRCKLLGKTVSSKWTVEKIGNDGNGFFISLTSPYKDVTARADHHFYQKDAQEKGYLDHLMRLKPGDKLAFTGIYSHTQLVSLIKDCSRWTNAAAWKGGASYVLQATVDLSAVGGRKDQRLMAWDEVRQIQEKQRKDADSVTSQKAIEDCRSDETRKYLEQNARREADEFYDNLKPGRVGKEKGMFLFSNNEVPINGKYRHALSRQEVDKLFKTPDRLVTTFVPDSMPGNRCVYVTDFISGNRKIQVRTYSEVRVDPQTLAVSYAKVDPSRPRLWPVDGAAR